MTKRLVIAAVFLSLALFISISSYVYLEITSEKIFSAIDELSEDIYEENAANELISIWDKNKKIYGVFLKHADADMLDRQFIVLEKSILEGDSYTALLTLRELNAYLHITLEGEMLKIENIF
ncbi:MAG: DUF4363 family protein [Clostridia bacterium]|nr:DUF4363 family protein [Clostridia bacterium]